MSQNIVNYNHLFHLIDDRRTFNEIGNPQNVLKTMIVMNVLMIIVAGGLCFIPIPFVAPVIIICYLISFTVLNIKYLRDFTTAVYQSDNLQIQKGIVKYESDEAKISDLQTQVDTQIEEDYSSSTTLQDQLQSIYDGITSRTTNSLSMFGAFNST
jgi:hypothetical protein